MLRHGSGEESRYKIGSSCPYDKLADLAVILVSLARVLVASSQSHRIDQIVVGHCSRYEEKTGAHL